MEKINIGEVVVFSTGDGLKTNVGLILKHKENDDYVLLTRYNSAYKNIKPEWISTLDKIEYVRNEIREKYGAEIRDIQSKIRNVTSDEKEIERITKYQELQKEIKIVAKRLSESTDDVDFENRLKTMSDLKKSIFSIKLECVSDIRKQNGGLKYKIRELEERRDSYLNAINDENIYKAFDFN